MRRLLLFAFITSLVTSVIAANRGELRSLALDMPERLMPGQPLPHDAICFWEHWGGERLYCQVGSAYLSYDPTQRVIARATFQVDKITAGDLILAWGTPSGETRSTYYAEIYWGKRSAFVLTEPYTAASEVSFVTVSAEPETVGPWRGFASE